MACTLLRITLFACRVAASVEGAKPKTDSASSFGEKVGVFSHVHSNARRSRGAAQKTPSYYSPLNCLCFPQRQQQLTSSATRSLTLKGQKKATVEKTRTRGSSVTSSKPVVCASCGALGYFPLLLICVCTFCVQGCSLWLSAVLQHLSCSTTGRAAGRADFILCSPTQCLFGLQVAKGTKKKTPKTVYNDHL